MTRIDDLAISKIFSPAAGWAEHRLGLGGLALSIAGKGMNDGIFANLLVALAWLLLMAAVRRVARRQAGSSLGVQTARMREWLFRLILLVALPVSVASIRELANFCYSVSLLLLLCHLYFKACDAPPPQSRRKLAFSRS